MKKRRRLANRVVIFAVILAIVSSVFFYVPMNVRASESLDSDISWTTKRSTVVITASFVASSQQFNYNGETFYIDFVASNLDISSFLSHLFEEGKCYVVDSAKVRALSVDRTYTDLQVSYGTAELLTSESALFQFDSVSFKYDGSSLPFKIQIRQPARCTAEPVTSSFHGFSAELTATYSFSVDIVYASISEERYEAYEKGFNNGYLQGSSDGQSKGYNLGFASGYNSGYSDGYTQGESSVDTDAYYQDGFEDGFDSGVGSVDTDAYYQDGFNEGFASGVNSVDTENIYNTGYESGYNSGYSQGYEDSYKLGYDGAYELGYSTAYEDMKKSSVASGDSKTVTTKIDIANSSLDIEDTNTTLPITYQNVTDYETYLDDSLSDHDLMFEYWHIDEDGGLIEGTLSDDIASSYTLYTFGLYEKNYIYGLGYYVDGVQKLFTASTDAYAYKITVKQSATEYKRSDIWKAWNIVGTQSDVQSGDADLGARFYSDSKLEHTYFIYTNNLPVDIYSGVLFYFFDSDVTSASYDLSSTLTIEYTPYSRTEYNQIVNSVDNLGGKIDNLTNGYDSSVGDSMNDNFSATLNEYQTAEDSLFSSAKDGLSGFKFVNIASYPTLVTALSFVTSLMTSLFVAVGGEGSPIEIVLSVLFSIMLVSMAIGLYKYYQSNGKGGDGG